MRGAHEGPYATVDLGDAAKAHYEGRPAGEEWLDRKYPIPEALTRGKARVTVTLRSHKDSAAGALVTMRTVRLHRE